MEGDGAPTRLESIRESLALVALRPKGRAVIWNLLLDVNNACHSWMQPAVVGILTSFLECVTCLMHKC
jgi:hypothetical protein